MDLRLDEAFIGSFSNALGPCHALLHVLLVSSLLRFAALDWDFFITWTEPNNFKFGYTSVSYDWTLLLYSATACACRTTWRCAATCAPTSTAEIPQATPHRSL